MLNIILIAMLASVIYNYLFNRNKITNLNCGIFAWVGVSSDKFSPVLFNVLGVYNDTRGGDSCGVYFNKNVITGIKTEAKYEALVKKERLHTVVKPNKYPVVIGHCRKASVGTVIEKNIQPVLVRNDKKNDKLMYVQAHNGTISNYKELVKKYDVEVNADESDSVAMARLIEKKGFQILAEYDGSAALVMYFVNEPNTLYAFHGKSKQYTYVQEERPLHYMNIKGYGTYISSEAAPLEFIANGEKATSFKYNMVYKLTKDEVVEFQEIKRKVTTFVTQSSEYWKTNGYYPKQDSVIPFNSTVKKGLTNNICTAEIESDIPFYNATGRIRFYKGFYMIGAIRAHGEVICDAFGYVRDKSFIKMADIYYLYFFYGIMMVNKESYDEVVKEANSMGILSAELFFQSSNFNLMNDTLTANSIFPYTKLATQYHNSGYMSPTAFWPNTGKDKQEHYYTGEYQPLFSDYLLTFENGDLEDYEMKKQMYTLTDFIQENDWFEEYMYFGKRQDDTTNATVPAKENKSDKGEVVCKTCGDTSCEFRGCTDTPFEPGDVCEHYVDQTDESSVLPTLQHTIASEITPIISDLESVISDVENSGFKELVAKEIKLMTEANNNLKNVLQ